MKKITLILVLLIVAFTETQACINEYYSIDKEGHTHTTDELHVAFNTNFNNRLIEKKLIKIGKHLMSSDDYKLVSDYAVLLLKGGKAKEALEIFKKLSKHYPNEYQIASNLGTAYEINGKPELALKYIKHGIELNPNSHEGSEWVHVKVLEAKLKLVKDKTYLKENSVLSLSIDNLSDSEIKNQILVQVKERFPFSPGPNQIMASLLMDLGDCFANSSSIEYAKVFYTIAKEYYGANEKIAAAKINEMVKLRTKYENVKPINIFGNHEMKVGGIGYKRMLENNNSEQYKVNWETVITDPGTLLSQVTLKKIETQDENQDEVETDSSTADAPNSTKKIMMGSAMVLLGGLLIYSKKRSSNK